MKELTIRHYEINCIQSNHLLVDTFSSLKTHAHFKLVSRGRGGTLMLTVPLVPLVHVTLPSYPRREILVSAVPFTFPSVTLNWKVWVRVAYMAPVSGR